MIPVVMRYDLGSAATLKSLQESPNVQLRQLRQAIFNFFDIYMLNYPIYLIFGIVIPITTRYNVISEASL